MEAKYYLDESCQMKQFWELETKEFGMKNFNVEEVKGNSVQMVAAIDFFWEEFKSCKTGIVSI